MLPYSPPFSLPITYCHNNLIKQKSQKQIDRQQSRSRPRRKSNINNLDAQNDLAVALYSDVFYAYVASGLTFFGCEPVLYPDGYQYPYPCSQHTLFAKGQYEDWLVYIFNNVTLLQCLFSAVTPFVSHYQRCWVYVLTLAISFFLTAFTNSLLVAVVSGLSSSSTLVFFNLIVMRAAVSICSLAAKTALRNLFELQEDLLMENDSVVKRVAGLFLVPALLTAGCVFLLILVSIFTASTQPGGLLLDFFLQVRVILF